MNAPQNAAATPAPDASAQGTCKTLVDTLLQVGTTWAAHGLKVGKVALSMSAETLVRTASTLETLAATIEKKAGAAVEAAPSAATGVDEAADAGAPTA